MAQNLLHSNGKFTPDSPRHGADKFNVTRYEDTQANLTSMTTAELAAAALASELVPNTLYRDTTTGELVLATAVDTYIAFDDIANSSAPVTQVLLESPNGTVYKVEVDNAGVLSASLYVP